ATRTDDSVELSTANAGPPVLDGVGHSSGDRRPPTRYSVALSTSDRRSLPGCDLSCVISGSLKVDSIGTTPIAGVIPLNASVSVEDQAVLRAVVHVEVQGSRIG